MVQLSNVASLSVKLICLSVWIWGRVEDTHATKSWSTILSGVSTSNNTTPVSIVVLWYCNTTPVIGYWKAHHNKTVASSSNDWVLNRSVHRIWANFDYDIQPAPEIKPETCPEKNMDLVFRPLVCRRTRSLERWNVHMKKRELFWKNIFGEWLHWQVSINSNISWCSSSTWNMSPDEDIKE